MAIQAKKTAVNEATWDRSPPRDRHAFDLGKRWHSPADRLDYMIRRYVIPDHPANNDRAVARTLPYRSSAPYLSWELTRMLSNRGNSTRLLSSLLSDLQAAIGRGLRAEYDLTPPMPGRLVDLLRKLEQPANP